MTKPGETDDDLLIPDEVMRAPTDNPKDTL